MIGKYEFRHERFFPISANRIAVSEGRSAEADPKLWTVGERTGRFWFPLNETIGWTSEKRATEKARAFNAGGKVA